MYILDPAIKFIDDAFTNSIVFKTAIMNDRASFLPLSPLLSQPFCSFQDKVTGFQRLLLLKALREDKLLEGVRDFASNQLGTKFASAPSASMEEIYAELDNATPCIFILSKGADPTGILLRFAKTMNYQVIHFELLLSSSKS